MKWIKYSRLNILINKWFYQVGIVGRTWAGKSSLLQAMFRCAAFCSTHFRIYSYLLFLLLSVVELGNGKIEIDGYNLRLVGLDVLRRGLALVPQDSTLFLGTLRDNL